MGSIGPDFSRRRLATSIEDWNEPTVYPRTFPHPLRQKAHLWSRLEKHRARQSERTEIANDNADTEDFLSDDPCRNGSCPFCHDSADENVFERTRMAAAQRGAI